MNRTTVIWHMGPFTPGIKANGVAVITETIVHQLNQDGLNTSFHKSTYFMLWKLATSKKILLPSIIHFHSGKVLVHCLLGMICRWRNIDYIIQPHGAYYPGLEHGDGRLLKFLKAIYLCALERYFLKGAIRLIATQNEERSLLAHRFNIDINIIAVLRNPMKRGVLIGSEIRDLNKIIYIGRFAIYHKGIDRIIELAKLLPEYSFELYGARNTHQIDEMTSHFSIPANLKLRTGIFGPAKHQLQRSSGYFIQMSRFEACATASIEALADGLPVLLVSDMAMAKYVTDEGRGIVLSSDLNIAADQIRDCDIVANSAFLERVNDWIDKELSPSIISQNLCGIYSESIKMPKSLASQL